MEPPQDTGTAVGQSSADDFVDGSAVNLDICVCLRDSTMEDGTGHNLADSAVVDNQMAVWMTALTGPIFAGADNLGQGNVFAVQNGCGRVVRGRSSSAIGRMITTVISKHQRQVLAFLGLEHGSRAEYQVAATAGQ